MALPSSGRVVRRAALYLAQGFKRGFLLFVFKLRPRRKIDAPGRTTNDEKILLRDHALGHLMHEPSPSCEAGWRVTMAPEGKQEMQGMSVRRPHSLLPPPNESCLLVSQPG
jgi:hypothetical protein